MRCTPVIVIRSSSAVRQGVRQLGEAPDDVNVVLIREYGDTELYYVFPIGDLRARLSEAPSDVDVATALHLNQFEPAVAGQLDSAAPAGSIALDGGQVVGIIVDDEEDVTPASQPPSQPGDSDGIRGSVLASKSFEDLLPPTIDVPTRGWHPTAGEEPAPVGLFRAYPDVRAPGQVGAGETFTVRVGFAAEPPLTMGIEGPHVPVIVGAGPEPEFIVQITGFGFTFPKGIQQHLVVERANPQSARVEFAVRADTSEAAAPRFLEVTYEFEGVVVGRAYAQVQVVAGGPAEPTPSASTGSSGVMGSMSGQGGPHLTVDIFSRPGDHELRWLFHCRYADIARPGSVATSLQEHSAQSFAMQLMRQVPFGQSGEFLVATMHGLGDDIADAIAAEFWPIFEQVWKRAQADGEQPRLQIMTTEPWIPWELAWIGRERLDEPDLLLPPGAEGATLGQLWQVGRWTTRVRHLPKGDVPASPPAATVDASEIAVVIGNYEGVPGVAELPHAVEEGAYIAKTYGGLPLRISDEDMLSLMNCTLQRDGREFRPTVIHFAGHGHTDVDNPQFTGLVLTNGHKLDRWSLRGFRAVAEQHPFVFLNACEAGVGGETLMQLGGLVGGFLAEGARGFIAPLWQVDDIEARDIALEFYRRTLKEGQTVGAAMRGIRGRYGPGSTSATALAYVFYGNPDLRLERSAG